jgi:hypothetical protein
MGVGTVDEEVLIEFAITALLDEKQEPRTIVASLVQRWPDAPPLSLLYILSMAAGGVEQMLSSPDIQVRAQEMWRLTGLVGVDLYTMHCMGLPQDSSADLYNFWRAHDPFFLT